MELHDAILRRRMVRNFTGSPVPAAVRDRILASALHAPSAGFSQGWAFVVLEGPEQTARFWSATAGDPESDDAWLAGMRRAPLLVVPLACKKAYLDRYTEADKGWADLDEARWPVPYWLIDTGFASLLMLLSAVDAGLGACFFGVPPERLAALRAELAIPDDHEPIGALAIGEPAADRPSPSLRRGRRPVSEVVHWGGW
ncbi:MAG: nitroreductase family protein [Acidimicrobiales bacterium]